MGKLKRSQCAFHRALLGPAKRSQWCSFFMTCWVKRPLLAMTLTATDGEETVLNSSCFSNFSKLMPKVLWYCLHPPVPETCHQPAIPRTRWWMYIRRLSLMDRSPLSNYINGRWPRNANRRFRRDGESGHPFTEATIPND